MTNLDALKNLVAGATASTTLRWLVCRHCGDILQHDMSTVPPATPCASCGEPFNRVTMPTLDAAQKAVAQAKANQTAQPVETPAVPAPEKPAAPVTPVAPEKVEPSNTGAPKSRTRKLKAVAPAAEPQTAPAVSVGAVVPPAVEEATEQAMEGERPDYAALREAAKQALLKRFPLNNVQWMKVFSGRVVTIGYTLWVDGKPETDWCEVYDTPQSFGERFRDARAQHPAVRVDAALVAGIPEEYRALGFQGAINASTREIIEKDGIRVMSGARVEIAAKLSKNGSVIWSVVGVAK